MPSDPLPLSPEEWPCDEARLLATLDREQEARTLARTEVIAEAVAAVEALTSWPRVSWFAYDAHLQDGTPANPTEDRVVIDREAVLAALSRLGERE